MLEWMIIVSPAVAIIVFWIVNGSRIHSDKERILPAKREFARARGFDFYTEWGAMTSALKTQIISLVSCWAGFRGELQDGVSVFGVSCVAETEQGRKWHREVHGARVDGVDFPMLVVYRRWRNFRMTPYLMFAGVVDVERSGFSRGWKVACSFPRMAHDLLHPRVIRELISAPTWVEAVWYCGDTIFVSSRGATAARSEEVLAVLSRLVALVPNFTLEELDTASPGELYQGTRWRRSIEPVPW